MSREEQVVLAELPGDGELADYPVFENCGAQALLRFVFNRDGAAWRGGLRFDGVSACRFRAKAYCALWHVEQAYDSLVEVRESKWIAELRADEDPEQQRWGMRHFMVYLDSAGCYEIVAMSSAWLPEERES